MKRFLRKRWHSIPVVSLVAVLLGLALVTGGVLAAYPFWDATAKVTVIEPMEVVLVVSNANIDWDGDDFSVTIGPGQTRKCGWDVTNTNTHGAALTVTPSVSPDSGDDGNLTLVWGKPGSLLRTQGYLEIAPGETYRFGLTIEANGSTTVGTYTFTLTFDRS